MFEPFSQPDPCLFIIVSTLFGLIIGSFLNVVICRLPIIMARETAESCFNLAVPRSHCFCCKHPICWYHNIPVLSYILLKGRCHHCQEPFGRQHILVELLTGILFGFSAWHFLFSMLFFAALVFICFGIVLFVLDLQLMILPDKLTLPLLWLGLWFNLDAIFVPLESAVIGAMTGYLSLWAIYWVFKILTKKEGLGYGDFKLFAAIGAFLGWAALPLVALVAAISALVAIIIRSLLKLGKADQPIPFGPFLIIAGFIILCLGPVFLRQFSLHGI